MRPPLGFQAHQRPTQLREHRPVGAVAEALGYCDPYFFSRQFKQQTGLTPVQFRRRAGRDFPV